MTIAIIPARGGSKRIPDKNIKQFAGKPIIYYSIRVALESELFDHIIVSTDSERIAAVARECGAETPFLRPAEISDDYTMLPPVLIHAIKQLQLLGITFDHFCSILPTSPLIQPEYIQAGYRTLIAEKVSSVISITSFPFPILRAFKLNKNGPLEMIWPEHEFSRSNDLEEAYHDAGQFYWLNTEMFLMSKRIFAQDAHPIILPRYLVQDIDTIEDWQKAEFLYYAIKQGKHFLKGENND